MNHLKTKHGFTLLELIIVMIISGIIIVGGSSLLLQGFKSYRLAKQSITNMYEVRFATERITNDLHATSYIKEVSSTYLNVHTNFGEDIKYTVSNNHLSRNNDTLANNIKKITFKYYTKDGNILDPIDPSIINKIAYINIYIESTTVNLSTTISLWLLC